MKFPLAWADIASQNVVLKIALVVLGVVVLALTVVSARLALKEPLIIERSCFSSVVPGASSPERTNSEIEAFVRESLTQRFDSRANVQPSYLSDSELAARAAEIKELAGRTIAQHILVNTIKVARDAIVVDADRVLSVGTVRSALSFPLSLSVGTTDRTAANPYGLTLTRVSPVKTEVSK